jgi:hypothetical protein
VGEEAGAEVDEPREELKDGRLGPRLAGPHAGTGPVEIGGDGREGLIAGDPLEYTEKNLHLSGLFFEVGVVGSDAETVGDVQKGGAGGGWSGCNALPLDGGETVPGRTAGLEHLGGQYSGDSFANPLGIWHGDLRRGWGNLSTTATG